jgi:hypothetical protein
MINDFKDLMDFSNNNIWQIYEVKDIIVPSTVDRSLFDTINVYGRTQLTYKGWPLYYFGQDNKVRGNNKGVSFPAPGLFPVAVRELLDAPGEH